MKKLPLSLKVYEVLASVPKVVSVSSIAVFGSLGILHSAYAIYLIHLQGLNKNIAYFVSSGLGCFVLLAIYAIIYQIGKLNTELVHKGVFLDSFFEKNNEIEIDSELEEKLRDLAIGKESVVDIKVVSSSEYNA